jgi:hypothetical protein
MSKFPILTIQDNKDEILIYNNGYNSNKENDIREIIHSLYHYDFKQNEVNEIVENICCITKNSSARIYI